MVNITSFLRKWNGRTLQDDGSRVSKEFHSFQVAFFNTMRKIAKGIGAEVVKPSYGHYDMSGFIKRGNKYVYFSYDNGIGYGGRTHIILKGGHEHDYGCHAPLLIRTAANDTDYRGGDNNFCPFSQCEELIEKLLNTEHHGW